MILVGKFDAENVGNPTQMFTELFKWGHSIDVYCFNKQQVENTISLTLSTNLSPKYGSVFHCFSFEK